MSPSGIVGYTAEEFSEEEKAILERYFTNTHLPVFAVRGLDEVVRAALFARYSRTELSLRRLFLTEFYEMLEGAEDVAPGAGAGMQRGTQLFDKVFFEYGDDSVAQLGGAHLACEQASNLLTKILEWGRLMGYLEQSTRYIRYDSTVNGLYRYYRDPEIMSSPMANRYVDVMDITFQQYSWLLEQLVPLAEELYPRTEGQSIPAWQASVRSKVLDNVRGLLPAATISNLGIYGSGQSYEHLLLRMRAHPLPEARAYADMMLRELRKVIPSFLQRVDLPDRGNVWSHYLEQNRNAAQERADALLADLTLEPTPTEVQLLDFDPDYEVKLVAAILAEQTHFSETQLRRRVEVMSHYERLSVLEAYFGDRSHNRRHKPGRQLEMVGYRFEILSDYGAFRDLQRHRMLTMTWQTLTPMHGYIVPPLIELSGLRDNYDGVLEAQATLFEELCETYPADAQPQYALGFAYRMRYAIQINARALTHMVELRTQPAGHDDYRRVCQSMHDAVNSVAGHSAIAQMMRYADYERYDLGRIEAEQRLEARRQTSHVED